MENNKLSVPAAIVIAGVLIAGAVIWNGHQSQPSAPEMPEVHLDKLMPIDTTDHVRGDANAVVKIVEYSDLECPFCKQFHQTMEQIAQAYGNKIAWVYRHLPLDRHPKAQKEAEASECVFQLGGEQKFWQYVDKIFEVTPSNNGLDESLLPKMAGDLGIDQTAFNACLTSSETAKRIKRDTENASAIGASYTPFSIIITKDGPKELGGAMPFDEIKKLIDKELPV